MYVFDSNISTDSQLKSLENAIILLFEAWTMDRCNGNFANSTHHVVNLIQLEIDSNISTKKKRKSQHQFILLNTSKKLLIISRQIDRERIMIIIIIIS